MRTRKVWMIVAMVVALLGTWRWTVVAQAPGKGDAGPKVDAHRFEFEVIESFDGKYLGDTQGHHGRNGGVSGRPRVALDDPVHRGDELVGNVTFVHWDRAKESLDIEFNPAPLKKVYVGDVVWISIGEQGHQSRKSNE